MQILKSQSLTSNHLDREVIFDLVIPPNYDAKMTYPVLLMNDGQDFDKLELSQALSNAWINGLPPFIYIGVHANKNRLAEYGTSGILDCEGRGQNSLKYQNFVISELLPFVNITNPLQKGGHVSCGFSMGGLSVLDMTLENFHIFSKVGVFSGAFWWRSKAYGPYYSDANDRIIHQKVKKSVLKPMLEFWFQCGTEDEFADRNNNGIIDSIDDTLDLIHLLKEKGYLTIHYEEVIGGKHNHASWKKVFPDFLNWAFT